MFLKLLILFNSLLITEQKHFNGGTINWAPIAPYNNSTVVPITITQTYSWTYPYISCANNVPISTSGWSGANRNLTCVVDCSTDGGYSTHPIDILTDCTSASTSLSMLSSTKSKNVTLNASAHFYLAYLGTAWVSLGYPSKSGLEWSILTFIDLRMRPDGFINTPPVATVISPQYAFVNQTININIPVSDANVGDDVRCRWSTYTSGYRRRRRSDKEERIAYPSAVQFYKKVAENEELIHIRRKRCSSGCNGHCNTGCTCDCSKCEPSACPGTNCTLTPNCETAVVFTTTTTTTTSTTSTATTTRTTSTATTTSTTSTATTTRTTSTATTTSTTSTATTTRTTSTATTTSTTSTATTTSTTSTATTTITTTTKTTTSTTGTETTTITTTASTTGTETTTSTTTTTTTTTDSSTTIDSSTSETIGTLKSTSTYPIRQSINECGDICFPSPGSVPNTTTLSNCTLSFTGTRAGVWYAVAIQVEDFIDSTSTTPMSSVPVQFLIYVMPQPACSKAPIILPVNGCLEVQVGVSMTFNLYALNLCNRTVANLTDIIVSSGISGMSVSNLTSLSTNLSLSYLTFTWIPQANQIGYQELCAIAYTSENLQSAEYCEIFTVKNSSDLCVPTTTTSTTTTTQSTTSTSVTTTTTSTTTTTESTTSTSETTSTSSTSTSTTSSTSSTSTSSTSTSSTSTSTSSTSTSTTTSSTSTASTSTSTTSTSTSTTTSSTSTTSTSTSTTSTSTSTTTSSTSTTSTSTSTTSTSTSTTTSSTSTTSTSTSTTSTSTSTTTSSTSTTSTTTSTTSTSTSTTTTSVTTTTVTTATTTTAKIANTAKKPTNWLLTLGLSLLALLLAICCSCCCLYCFLWGPAARRRREKNSANDREHRTNLRHNRSNVIQRRHLFSRMYQPNSLNHDSSNLTTSSTLHGIDSIMSNSSQGLHLRLSNSTIVMTDVEESRISPTVSIKRIRRSDIANINNIQKSNEIKNTDTKLANKGDNNGYNLVPRHSTISVVRVKKGSNMEATNRPNLNTTQQETLNVTSTIQKRASQVNVTKLPRIKSIKNQRPRAVSMGNISVIHVDKSSIKMQLATNRSKSSMPTADSKANTKSGVTVIKLPRKLTNFSSH